ncbi:MAG: hypothetical protein WAM61_00365 [Desulfobacterales bacterium]
MERALEPDVAQPINIKEKKATAATRYNETVFFIMARFLLCGGTAAVRLTQCAPPTPPMARIDPDAQDKKSYHIMGADETSFSSSILWSGPRPPVLPRQGLLNDTAASSGGDACQPAVMLRRPAAGGASESRRATGPTAELAGHARQNFLDNASIY